MKITRDWLQEFTPIEVGASQLAQELTMAGLEVESVSPVAPLFTDVVVGLVIECTRHPDAEKLSVCQVTTDGTNRLQIVCGAANVRAGLNVAVAMLGARLPNNIVIKRAKLRGLESQGMLCSARELGLGAEHEGIMELPVALSVGTDLREALDLDDVVLEVNVTPNRGDCMSVFGVARDYAAARSRVYLTQKIAPVTPVHNERISVMIVAAGDCPAFASRVIRKVSGGVATPLWMRERLRRVGINSISPVVDVTNYVMIELGQPMHAYDRHALKGGLVVRRASAQECLSLLDDQEYLLDPEFVVVADDAGAAGLAGIMGGRRTAISDTTTDIVLEAAHWVPDAIAGRARRLGLFTDAGQRFERGVDPSLLEPSIERATALLLEITGGEPGPVVLSRAAGEESHSGVILRRARLARMLGASIPDSEVLALLGAISDQVEILPEGWLVRSPPHRFDLRIEADLIEEVLRLRGFDSILEYPAAAPQSVGYAPESVVSCARVADALADRGYHEAITYSFVDPVLQAQLFPNTPSLALKNPIAADMGVMRVSLWPGLLQAVRANLRRQQTRVRLFEIGKRFNPSNEGLLDEVETFAGIATGARWPEQWSGGREPLDYFDVKADLVNVLSISGPAIAIEFKQDSLSCLRPGRTARIYREDIAIGWLGELHPALVRNLGLAVAPLLFELDITSAFNCSILKFNNISKFPSIRRDLAVVVGEHLPLTELLDNVTVSAAGLLSELRVFDVYRGPGVDLGRKSIALGLILKDSSRTLTDVDADAVVAAVIARLRDKLSATIRD